VRRHREQSAGIQLQTSHHAHGTAQRVGLVAEGRASATIRVNGDLVALDTAPLKPEELKSLAEQIMTPRQVKEFAEHKEADFAIGVPGVGRFRTNVYQQRGTVAFAFRAISVRGQGRSGT